MRFAQRKLAGLSMQIAGQIRLPVALDCLLLSLLVALCLTAGKGNNIGDNEGAEEEEEQCELDERRTYANFGFDTSGAGIDIIDDSPQVIEPVRPPVNRLGKLRELCNVREHGYMCEFADLCGNSSASQRRSYIYNGDYANEFEFPSFVQLRVAGGSTCSGVIVSDRHVATAAQCLVSHNKQIKPRRTHPSLVTVFAGALRGWPRPSDHRQEFQVARICFPNSLHLGSNLKEFTGNFAILKLASQIRFNERIQPACWPYRFRLKPKLTGPEAVCYLLGMGKAEPYKPLPNTPANSRKEGLNDLLIKWRVEVKKCDFNESTRAGFDSYCIKEHGGQGSRQTVTCPGDSGGPMLCRDSQNRHIVVGLISRVPTGCGPSEQTSLVKRLDQGLLEAKLTTASCASDYPTVPTKRRKCDKAIEGPLCVDQAVCGSTVGTPYRLGDEHVRPHEFPYFALVQVRGYSKICAAAIVSSTQVVTSSRCLFDSRGRKFAPSALQVLLGSPLHPRWPDENRQELQVASYCTSKRKMRTVFGHDGAAHEVATLTVGSALQFNERIQPACWPDKFRQFKRKAGCVMLGVERNETKIMKKTQWFVGHLNKAVLERNVCDGEDKGYMCFKANQANAGVCEDLGAPILCRDDSSQWVLWAVVQFPDNCIQGKKVVASEIDPTLDANLLTCKDDA